MARDPYFRKFREYLIYFQNICNKLKEISLTQREVNYLRYFINNPHSSAYDIRRIYLTNSEQYRRAKIILNKLHEVGLIKLYTTTKNKNQKNKHNAKYYYLTDYGIFLLNKI